jgi:hypothetical protein
VTRFDLAAELQNFDRVVAPRVRLLPKTLLVPTVYHYTAAAGAAGILMHCELRATNFGFLNDPSELTYGRGIVRAVAKERAISVRGPASNLITAIAESVTAETAADVYVTSFSEEGDDLAQWRGYGGAQNERYAIGFRSEAIDALSSKYVNSLWDKVLYDPDDQIQRVRDIVDRAAEFIVQRSVPASALQPFTQIAAFALARIMPTLKDESYAAEREWRFVLWPSPDARIDFDTSRGVIRPFIRWSLGQAQTISEVVVLAPGRREAALKAAEILLRRAKIANVTPTYSKIPFVD